MKRGEIRWYTFRLPDKRRPVLILTRNEVVDRLNEIIVVPVTRKIRGLTTEVTLTQDDGMPVECALNFDHVSLAQRDRIGGVLCNLPETRKRSISPKSLVMNGPNQGRVTYSSDGVDKKADVKNMNALLSEVSFTF